MASGEQVQLWSGEGESYAKSADICHETILFSHVAGFKLCGIQKFFTR